MGHSARDTTNSLTRARAQIALSGLYWLIHGGPTFPENGPGQPMGRQSVCTIENALGCEAGAFDCGSLKWQQIGAGSYPRVEHHSPVVIGDCCGLDTFSRPLSAVAAV
jgi:hypothetical protein